MNNRSNSDKGEMRGRQITDETQRNETHPFCLRLFTFSLDAEMPKSQRSPRKRVTSSVKYREMFGTKTALTPVTAIYLPQKNVVGLDVAVQQSHFVQLAKAVADIKSELQLVGPIQTHGWPLVVLSAVEQRAK